MATPVLQFKRGAFSNLPALKAGEPGFTTDKYDFYIGLDNTLGNNKFFGSHRYWTRETTTVGSGVNLVEGTNNGTDFITLAAPGNIGAAVTYTFPASPTDGAFLKTNSTGSLSWSTQITNPNLTNANLTGITTIGATDLDVNAGSIDISGITTFSNTTDNTLGDENTGAVQIDGGVGIAKNLTVKQNLHVGGYSEFVGVATFRGGTINLGDADTDDINVAGEFISNLIPNVDNSFDIGQGTTPKRWRHANFSGVGTFATGAVADGLQLGITAANEIDTASGNLTLDSAGGTVIVDDQLSVTGVSTFTGAIDANGGATIDNIQIGVSDNNEIDTSSGGLTLDSASGQTIIDDNLSVTGVSTFTGATTFTGAIDANGGATIDNIQIGISGDNEIDTSTGNLTLDSAGGTVTVDDNLTVVGQTDLNGDVNIGDAVTDSVTVTGRFDSDLIPLDDSQRDLGTTGLRWAEIYGDALTIDNVQIGVSGTGEIDTDAGNLTLDSAGGTVTVDDNLTVTAGNDIVLSDLTNTRVLLAGSSSEITDSADLTFTGNVLTVVNTIDVTTVEATNLKAKDGTTSITISNTTGNVGVASDLTVSGNLTVLGSQTEVNTETLLVEDSLIEVGLVNSGGSLVAPSSDANIDVGVIFHYFDSAARKAAVYWDDSVSRIVVASVVSESASVLTASTYADFEIGGLYVNDCAGSSQVISCTGSERFLENITIDAGTF